MRAKTHSATLLVLHHTYALHTSCLFAQLEHYLAIMPGGGCSSVATHVVDCMALGCMQQVAYHRLYSVLCLPLHHHRAAEDRYRLLAFSSARRCY